MTSTPGVIGINSRPGGFSSSSKLSLAERAVRIIQFRRILRLLVARDLKVRYAGSVLGYLWTVLDPLLMTLVYWVIFTKIFSRTVGYEPYVLFLICGQLPWAWFNGGVTACVRAFRNEAQMIRSTNVPRELWVLRVVASKGVEYLFSLPVMALFALAYLKAPDWRIVFLPLACLLIFVLVTGIGLLLAPLNVLMSDVERVVPIVMRMMFYLSPVLYTLHNATSRSHIIAKIYGVNPMVGPLCLAKAAFFPRELDWHYVIHSIIATVVIFVLGLAVFLRLERQVLKEV